jgi:hypothetical protein
MTYRPLLWYQTGIAASDTFTGISLLLAPLFTLRMMHIVVSDSTAVFISWIGSFVASVGIACAYGVKLMICGGCTKRLETVWLLTAISRGMVAAFLITNIATGALTLTWFTVALFDGGCALFQVVGLRREWLKYVIR